MQGTRCVYACVAATVAEKLADGWGWVALSCCQPVLYCWAVDTWGQRCRGRIWDLVVQFTQTAAEACTLI
jgi:hypothetical protein